MENIANMKLVELLLESEVTAYEVEKKTGITRMAISKYRNGQSQVINMPLGVAIKLTEFAQNQISIKAGELLDWMKNSNKRFNYVIKKDGYYLKNSDTGNFQEIYSMENEEGHFYGVYGDVVNGQVDSRTHADTEIKQAIVKMLSEGNIVDRNEI